MVEPSTDAPLVTRKFVQACALGDSSRAAIAIPKPKSLKDVFIDTFFLICILHKNRKKAQMPK
jgi:hypothetical protein